jgi:acyl-CoA synthetase (NDP forming)/GNAT superfamily N-acetyltransferase
VFAIIPEGADYREFVLLKDGRSILLRLAVPDDADQVEQFMNSRTKQTLALRFMAGVARVSRKFVEDLCACDPRRWACLLAVEGEDQRILGLGNYVGDGGNLAEVAFVVSEEDQGRGIATLILEKLGGLAAGAGFVGFEAEVLFENQKMVRVFRDSGFETRQALEGGIIHVRFPLNAQEAMRERVATRERVAVANSLVPLLRPKTVAVVGASRDPSSLGNALFRNILQGRFKGTVYPVNPRAAAIEGVRAYASLTELPEAPDLVILAVPASKVLSLAKKSLDMGCRSLLVLAAGFAETGPEGARRQERLVKLVRSRGARLVGPNCLGLLNTDAAVQLNASLASALPPRGRVGFFSHSAALGVVILQYAAERGLGFSTFVSAGNRADVSGNDLVQYWEEDPDTDLALLYLETFGNARRFARLARRMSHRKPILCVKSARSGAGRRMAQAHIGASPQNDAEVEALFQQAGVIRADTLEELFDIALLLSHQPLPRGNRVAVVSNSGGVATICADACESRGMEIAGPGLVDLQATATAEHYEQACLQALQHPDVDALIATFACVGSCDPSAIARAIRRAAVKAERATGLAKPTLLSLMGVSGAVPVGLVPKGDRGAAARTFPSYRFPESAALALSKVVDYARFRLLPPGRILGYEGMNAAAARKLVESSLQGIPREAPPQVMKGPQALALLGHFGLPLEGGQPQVSPRKRSLRVVLSLTVDPDFGPIWRFHRRGVPSILRITPLTDLDISGVMEALHIPAACGMAETLGRLTQMVEELPWLHAFGAQVEIPTEEIPNPGPLPLLPNPFMSFSLPTFRLP